MRLDRPLPIAAAVTWLPAARATVADAVAAGLIDSDDATRNAFGELPVSSDRHGPEMAAAAATVALAASGWPPDELDLVLHAWTHHQGLEFWSPAHFVASRVGAHGAVSIGIQQMCNGGAMALELGAAYLQGNPAALRVLVTTGDRFAAPAFDRWGGDYGVAYGDGGTALLLASGGPGALELVGIATVAAPELEAMHRGDEPFDQTANGVVALDIRRRKKAFMVANGRERFTAVAAECARIVVQRALNDAQVSPDDVRQIAFPRLGRSIVEAAYGRAREVVAGAAAVNVVGRTGHLGAGDCTANLAHLASDGLLGPGDLGVVLSAGAGFSWTCAVVRAR